MKEPFICQLRRGIAKIITEITNSLAIGSRELKTLVVEGRDSFDEQLSLVCEELHRLAASVLRSEQNAKVTPTTLVHEAWLKLAHSPEIAATSLTANRSESNAPRARGSGAAKECHAPRCW